MAKLLKLKPPSGFVAGGIAAGIKGGGKLDLGMILCERATTAAGLTTTNRFPAAPILLCRRRLAREPALRGIIVNSGNANAMTGEEGLADAKAMAEAAEAATGSPAGSFLVASTGIIGQRLPMRRILGATPGLAARLSVGGWTDFAEAIRTTDTRRKVAGSAVDLPGGGRGSILGIAKGVGMIEPNLATMLVFLLTDYPLRIQAARSLLRSAVEASFHNLTVDGQTSTNDVALLLSSGPVSEGRYAAPSHEQEGFGSALTEVCRDLARQIAADGEGATKLITVVVEGTATAERARRLAKEVAHSSLVRTAIAGENPNWGRIVQALGQSRVRFDPERLSIGMQGIELVREGRPLPADRVALGKAMRAKEITIAIRVGGGSGSACVWTCDLTEEYVRINAEYN
jgi:glutamate N-acetyltransferase/amino-acid N-acetyltransferase